MTTTETIWRPLRRNGRSIRASWKANSGTLKPLTSPSPRKNGERECTTCAVSEKECKRSACNFYDGARRFTPSPCEIRARLRDGTKWGEGGVRGDLTNRSPTIPLRRRQGAGLSLRRNVIYFSNSS